MKKIKSKSSLLPFACICLFVQLTFFSFAVEESINSKSLSENISTQKNIFRANTEPLVKRTSEPCYRHLSSGSDKISSQTSFPKKENFNVELVGQVGSSLNAITVHGNYAYLGEGQNLTILDVSNSDKPIVTAKIFLTSLVEDISILNNLAYIAGGESGLQIVDISDPAAPVFKGSFDTPGYAYGIYTSGNLAYISDGDSGLQIIDVSAPASPQFKGSYDTPGNASDVFTSGTITYIADEESGLQIIDTVNPATPVLISSYNTPGSAFKLDVSGNLVYIADSDSNLQIIDVSNPKTPVLAGNYYSYNGCCNAIFVDGNKAYLTFTEGTYSHKYMEIIDVSDPSAPVLYQMLNDIEYYKHGYGVFISGDNAYAILISGSHLFSEMRIIDVKSSESLVLKGSYKIHNSITGIFVSDNTAYIANWNDANLFYQSGLFIMDISNPSIPTLITCAKTAAGGRNIFVSENVVYLGEEEAFVGYTGIEMIDVSNPFKPIAKYRPEIQWLPSRIYVSGNLAYIPFDNYSVEGLIDLRIFDISNPSGPVSKGGCKILGDGCAVYVDRDFAYIANGSYGLHIIDVSNPNMPETKSRVDIPGYSYSLHVSGNYAYVSIWGSTALGIDSGLQIIDISNPAAPVLKGRYKTQGDANDVYASGGLAYIADEISGLQVLDISNPDAPVLLGSFDTQGEAMDIFLASDLVYVADGSGGIYILRYTGAIPITPTPSPTPVETPPVTPSPTPTETPTPSPSPPPSPTPLTPVMVEEWDTQNNWQCFSGASLTTAPLTIASYNNGIISCKYPSSPLPAPGFFQWLKLDSGRNSVDANIPFAENSFYILKAKMSADSNDTVPHIRLRVQSSDNAWSVYSLFGADNQATENGGVSAEPKDFYMAWQPQGSTADMFFAADIYDARAVTGEIYLDGIYVYRIPVALSPASDDSTIDDFSSWAKIGDDILIGKQLVYSDTDSWCAAGNYINLQSAEMAKDMLFRLKYKIAKTGGAAKADQIRLRVADTKNGSYSSNFVFVDSSAQSGYLSTAAREFYHYHYSANGRSTSPEGDLTIFMDTIHITPAAAELALSRIKIEILLMPNME